MLNCQFLILAPFPAVGGHVRLSLHASPVCDVRREGFQKLLFRQKKAFAGAAGGFPLYTKFTDVACLPVRKAPRHEPFSTSGSAQARDAQEPQHARPNAHRGTFSASLCFPTHCPPRQTSMVEHLKAKWNLCCPK